MAPSIINRSPSPDPLAISQDNISFSSPAKKTRVTTPKKHLQNSNGNVRSSDIWLTTPPAPRFSSSPTKSITQTDNIASPWRIRVTVEAEPENAEPGSPTKRLAQHTTTMTIPLKKGMDSSPTPGKKAKGRPRKSLEAPIKRSGTPKPKTTSKRKTMSDELEVQADEVASEATTPARRGRGRPRKSMGTTVHGSGIQASRSEEEEGAFNAEGLSSATKPTKTSSKGRGRRTARSSATAGSPGLHNKPVTPNHEDSMNHEIQETPESQADGIAHHAVSPQGSTYANSDVEKDDEARWRSKLRGYDSVARYRRDHLMIDREPRSPSMWGKPRVEEDKQKADPTEEHQEYDSVLESEGFSMVSVSSLHSAQQNSESQSVMRDSNQGQASSIELPSQAAQDGALTKYATKVGTPAIAPSPAMPPPPIPSAQARSSPRPLTKPTDGTPTLTRIVRAGIALQGVLSPKTSGISGNPSAAGTASSSRSTSSKSPKQRMDELFSGFGPGTRRELRAGLRLGEELAKRQPGSRGNTNVPTQDDVFSQDASPKYPELPESASSQSYSLRVPVAEDTVEYPVLKKQQLPSPEDSLADDEDRMSWKASSPKAGDLTLPNPHHESADESNEHRSSNLPIDSREAEWQREREAVSKQIEKANTSQVIVIDSDSELHLDEVDEEDPEDQGTLENNGEDDLDIWQAEAQSSKLSNKSPPDTIGALFANEATKPKRGKLPKTWRRHSQVVYSDEIEPEQSEAVLRPTEDAFKVIHKGEVAQQQIHEGSSPMLACQASESPTNESVYDDEMSDNGQSLPTHPPHVATDDLKKLTIKKTERLLFSSGHSQVQPEDPKFSQIRTNMMGSHTEPTYSKVISTTFKQTLRQPSNTKATTPPGFPPAYLYETLYLPPTPPHAAPTSWLTRLFGSTTTTLHSSPTHDLISSPPAPLYTHLPFTLSHHLLFLNLFLTQLHSPNIYPFNPYSPHAPYLSHLVAGQGWEHYTSKSDIALIDHFLSILSEKGVRRAGWLGAWGNSDGEIITGRKVMSLVFQWWRNGVLHGDYPLREKDGNKTGVVLGTERPWTKADIVIRCSEEDEAVPNPANRAVTAEMAKGNGMEHWRDWLGQSSGAFGADGIGHAS